MVLSSRIFRLWAPKHVPGASRNSVVLPGYCRGIALPPAIVGLLLVACPASSIAPSTVTVWQPTVSTQQSRKLFEVMHGKEAVKMGICSFSLLLFAFASAFA